MQSIVAHDGQPFNFFLFIQHATDNGGTYYPEFKDYNERKIEVGKPKMLILNSVRNKIVLRIAAVIKKQQAKSDSSVNGSIRREGVSGSSLPT